MKRILTSAQAREIDRIAIEGLGLPGIILMEHAGRAVAESVWHLLHESPGRVVVVTGSGNNGGDGYVAARLLLVRGVEVEVVSVVPEGKLAGDAAANAKAFKTYGGSVSPFQRGSLDHVEGGDVVVDALFGTGLSRPPRGVYAAAIEAMGKASERGAKIVSVDLPSGICADTGRVLGQAVQADATITFGAYKRGLVCQPGAEYAGAIEVAEISWPPGVVESIRPSLCLLDEEYVYSLIPPRKRETHKGSYGHCLIVAGSEGKVGAAAMAALGALVGGAGLTTVAARPDVLPSIMSHAMEMMGVALGGEGPLSLQDENAILAAAKEKDALLIGPGIPRDGETGELIGEILAKAPCPVVLDADALNALEGKTHSLGRARVPVVITPHPGEMSRLTGISVPEIQADRIETARTFAQEKGCVVVLKGAGTVIADPDGGAAICPVGNPGMATGGSGDVLGGLLAALLAQDLSPGAASRAAVYVHGLAGDRMAQRRGMTGLVASDLLEGIGEVWASWDR